MSTRGIVLLVVAVVVTGILAWLIGARIRAVRAALRPRTDCGARVGVAGILLVWWLAMSGLVLELRMLDE